MLYFIFKYEDINAPRRPEIRCWCRKKLKNEGKSLSDRSDFDCLKKLHLCQEKGVFVVIVVITVLLFVMSELTEFLKHSVMCPVKPPHPGVCPDNFSLSTRGVHIPQAEPSSDVQTGVLISNDLPVNGS